MQLKKLEYLKNQEILKQVIKTVVLCGKQRNAFRDHREDIYNSNKYGNVPAFSKLLPETNSNLKHHLDIPSVIENELIEIISYYISQKGLAKEMKEVFSFNGR